MKTLTYKPFVNFVIQHLNNYDLNVLNTSLIIFPTELSIDYFQSIWQNIGQHHKPTCQTLRQYIFSTIPIQPIPTLTLLQKLHTLCKNLVPNLSAFQTFYPLGVMLLEDFDFLDRHLINGSECLSTLIQQNLLPKYADIQNLEGLDQLFEQLPLIYKTFTQTLIQKNIGYEGLCYKIAAYNDFKPNTAFNRLIFVGFNYFTPSEERFIITCQNVLAIQFFWDTDPYYLDNESHLAGAYLRKYKKHPFFKKSFPFTKTSYFTDQTKQIVTRPASSTIEQIQWIIKQLKDSTTNQSPLLPQQTALIIGHMDLLIPLFDKLSALNIPLHCKVQYPIYATLIYHFLEQLIQIWQYSNTTPLANKQKLYQDLTNCLTALAPLLPSSLDLRNLMLKPKLLDNWLQNIPKGLLPYLGAILTFINEQFTHESKLSADLNKQALQTILWHIEHFYTTKQEDITPAFFLKILRNSTISYHQYNPLTGLYIVDILESHNLDFENLFFLNMNEGYFPKIQHNPSLLNYYIGHNLALNSTEQITHKQTSYGFYRLLQRAQLIYCSYVEPSPFGIANETSRLLLQLSLDSPLPIISQNQTHTLAFNPKPLKISLTKDQTIMQLLAKFLANSSPKPTALTPSALISYLTCPLQFYFAYLLQLKQTRPSKDEKEALQLGQLLHKVIEKLYQPLIGKPMDKTSLTHLKSKLPYIIQEEIETQPNPSNNSYAFVGSIVEKLIERIIDLDIKTLPLTLLGLEMGKHIPITTTLPIAHNKTVQLGGIIDRIDIKAPYIRLIDYKTGQSYNKFSTIEDLFNSKTIQQNKAIWQLIFYAWLFKKSYDMQYKQHITPCLIQIKDIFLEDYTPHIFIKTKTNQMAYKKIDDITPYIAEFQKELTKLLNTIFNPSLPFSQTENKNSCTYCPYILICQKDKTN